MKENEHGAFLEEIAREDAEEDEVIFAIPYQHHKTKLLWVVVVGREKDDERHVWAIAAGDAYEAAEAALTRSRPIFESKPLKLEIDATIAEVEVV